MDDYVDQDLQPAPAPLPDPATTPTEPPPSPSAWVTSHLPRLPSGGTVLDVAAGSGRHVELLAGHGHPVVAIDRGGSRLTELAERLGVEVIEADLETGPGLPTGTRTFAGVVVTNYLHRPLLPHLIAAVAPGGALIYETFARGNERYGKPRSPDFLLQPDELLDAVRPSLHVVAFEQTTEQTAGGRTRVVQRICAINGPH